MSKLTEEANSTAAAGQAAAPRFDRSALRAALTDAAMASLRRPAGGDARLASLAQEHERLRGRAVPSPENAIQVDELTDRIARTRAKGPKGIAIKAVLAAAFLGHAGVAQVLADGSVRTPTFEDDTGTTMMLSLLLDLNQARPHA